VVKACYTSRMNIEQTVQFILDTQAKLEASAQRHDERLARIEAAIEVNTGRIAQLVDVSLSIAHHAVETDRRMQETDKRIRELAEETTRRFQDTDDRLNVLIDTVDKLVRRNGQKSSG
jgi:regulator of sigma D